MRKGLVIAWLILLFTIMGGVFWRSEWVYALPTPVPANYHAVANGTRIEWPEGSKALLSGGSKPLFLHFFNPECPCSKFNIPHFRDLAKTYGQKADFAVVLMTNKQYAPEDIRRRFGLPSTVPVLQDTMIAAACGVYSTPQAVIVDTSRHLFFRGNYNRSRYCADEKTSYARLALESLLRSDAHPIFDPMALKAYGCKLPSCTQ